MKLDKSKPYGEVMGSTDGSKYEQFGNVFDRDGNLLTSENVTINAEEPIQPKKLGRHVKHVA